MIATEEDLTERHPKVGAEDCIDDGIQETVKVAEPQDQAEKERRVVAVVAAERAHDGDDEERKPAEYKGTSYDGQGACRLALSLLLQLHLGAILATGRRTTAVLLVRDLRHVHQTAVQPECRRRHRVQDVLVVSVGVAAVAFCDRPQLGWNCIHGRR